MNTTQEEAAFDGLRDFNSTALAQVVQDWVRLLQMTLMVYFIIIGVLLSIIITCGTVGWAKGWFNEDEDEDDDDEEEEEDEENDDTLSSSSHVAVDIGEEDEDAVELASISSISVHSDPRSLPRPEEEEERRLNDDRLDSDDDENDEAENHGWMGNCYMS